FTFWPWTSGSGWEADCRLPVEMLRMVPQGLTHATHSESVADHLQPSSRDFLDARSKLSVQLCSQSSKSDLLRIEAIASASRSWLRCCRHDGMVSYRPQGTEEIGRASCRERV